MPGFERLPKHVVIPELNNIDRMERIRQALERGGFAESHDREDHGGQLDSSAP